MFSGDDPMDFSANSFWKKSVPLRVKHALRILLMGGLAILSTSAIGQVGDLPVPVLQGVQVLAGASFDLGSQRYTYNYMVANPRANTGEIWHLGLDIRPQIPPTLGSSGLTI